MWEICRGVMIGIKTVAYFLCRFLRGRRRGGALEICSGSKIGSKTTVWFGLGVVRYGGNGDSISASPWVPG